MQSKLRTRMRCSLPSRRSLEASSNTWEALSTPLASSPLSSSSPLLRQRLPVSVRVCWQRGDPCVSRACRQVGFEALQPATLAGGQAALASRLGMCYVTTSIRRMHTEYRKCARMEFVQRRGRGGRGGNYSMACKRGVMGAGETGQRVRPDRNSTNR